jgi:hypothetical protein
MYKKDIYEHLAKIYLDASFKKKKKLPKYLLFKNLFFISTTLICGLSIFLFVQLAKNKPLDSEIALVLQPDAVKINFNFNPAKKEIYSLDLKGLDLIRFKALGFSLKKANYLDKVSLRVEFTSVFKEKSAVYLKDIPHKWQNYKINFSDFKDISEWSRILNLSFIVEEWNVKENKGLVYIDNIRLIK